MNEADVKRYEMLQRVDDFVVTRPAAAPPGTLAAELFATVASAVERIAASSSALEGVRDSARTGSAARNRARALLREEMEAISRTARAMAVHDPSLSRS